jgi:hypothetical protein
MFDHYPNHQSSLDRDGLKRAIVAFVNREWCVTIAEVQRHLRGRVPTDGDFWLGYRWNAFMGIGLSYELTQAFRALLREGRLRLYLVSPDDVEFLLHHWLIPKWPVAKEWPEAALEEKHWLPVLLVPGAKEAEAASA